MDNKREYRRVACANVSGIQTLVLFNLLDEFQLFLNPLIVDGKSIGQSQLPPHGLSPFAPTARDRPHQSESPHACCGQRWFCH